jgi:transcriptional regulator with GAF, ATPase, and Fis domain
LLLLTVALPVYAGASPTLSDKTSDSQIRSYAMAAFALADVIQTRYYIRLDSTVAGSETDHALLLDAARTQTDSQTAVIYGLQRETSELNGVTARSSITARVKDVGVTLSNATSQWIDSLAGAVQGTPAESNLERFPEVLQYQLKRLIVVPLRTDNDLLGLLTLGRLADSSFDPLAIEVAQRAGRLLTAVLERDSLQQKLLERKLVERAKGILQQRRKLSEEQAYLLLRNNSRRRRMLMVNLAKEIIESYVQRDMPPRVASGINVGVFALRGTPVV